METFEIALIYENWKQNLEIFEKNKSFQLI